MYHRYEGGWIEVICGSMFSGKTEELIRRINRAKIAHQKVCVYKSSLDNRYLSEKLSSHSGRYFEATLVQNGIDILRMVESDAEVIAVDEVQFFDSSIVEACSRLADQGKRVIAAGLEMDFRGEPFGPMPILMAQAEMVDKMQAICVKCGAPANRTQRLIDGKPAHYNDPVILVGANEVYEARCRMCHEVPR